MPCKWSLQCAKIEAKKPILLNMFKIICKKWQKDTLKEKSRSHYITVSQNLKSHMNKGQRLNYILDRSLYNSKMIEGEKSIIYRPVF